MSRRAGNPLGNRFRAWWRQHAYSLVYSVGNISRRPMAVVMTAATLGVALALPLLLRVALLNFEAVETVRPLEGISVFLVQEADGEAARQLARRVGGWPGVDRVELTSPEDGLKTFMNAGGLGTAAAELAENPLPWVVGVLPKAQSPDAIRGLVERLRDEALVASARADLRWLQRLRGMLDLARAVALGLGLLFALAVLLVVFNTTGTEVEARREEIEVLALVGATDSFIRRPFLYSGFWYGLLGGLFALVVLLVAAVFLSEPLGALADAYDTDFGLRLPPAGELAAVVLGSGLLGLAGAWLGVSRRLRMLAEG